MMMKKKQSGFNVLDHSFTKLLSSQQDIVAKINTLFICISMISQLILKIRQALKAYLISFIRYTIDSVI